MQQQPAAEEKDAAIDGDMHATTPGEARADSGIAPAPSPATRLFRHEALRAYERGEPLASPLHLTPLPTRVLFVSCLMVVLGALSVAVIGEVELTSLGRGVIRAPVGVQPLASSVMGLVAETWVESGAHVKAGDKLVRIDAPEARAAVFAAEQHLAATAKRLSEEHEHGERMYKAAAKRLVRRAWLVKRRARSQHKSAARLERKAQRVENLDREGLIDGNTAEAAGQELDNAERAFMALEDQLAQTQTELGRLQQERDNEAARREQELSEARAALDATRILLDRSLVRAPRDGQVEALSVRTGQLVQAGSALGRIVPEEAPNALIAFLPERDRAFLREGVIVRLDVDRLPAGEFGSLPARVIRISQDIAEPDELTHALGAAAPEGVWFRVTLELRRDERLTRLRPYLRSGTLVTVRAPLRTRRIIALMFDPIRRWLEE